MRLRTTVQIVMTTCALLMGGSALGQNAAQPTQVDLRQSRVYILVGKTGLGHEHGVAGLLASGTLRLGAARDAGSLVFDMTSFKADSPRARDYVGLKGQIDDTTKKQVDDNLRGTGVLDVQRFPTATFNIRSAVAADPRKPGLMKLDGEFTLHGVTRPLQVLAQSESIEGKTHLTGRFTILQSDYGIKPFSKLLGAVGVTDQLIIWGDIWLQ
jgi:hypothetical protein